MGMKKAIRNTYSKLVKMRDFVLKKKCVSMYKPIFIWGIGRSGTHLLLDILSLHPALTYPKTTSRWKKGLWGDMNWGDTTPEHLKDYPIPYEGLRHFWLDAGIPYDSIGFLTRDDLTENQKKEVRRRYSDLHRVWFWERGCEYRVLDKTPAYILMADAIDSIFPDSLHIFCIRDPRSVLNSILRMYRFPDRSDKGRTRIAEIGFWGLVPVGYEEHLEEPLVKRLCWQLQTLQDIGFANGSFLGERLIPFHYECLLNDSHKVIRELFDCLELPQVPQIIKLIPPHFPDYSPPWPQHGHPPNEPYGKIRAYKDEEIDQLSEIEELAIRLGYKPSRPGVLS